MDLQQGEGYHGGATFWSPRNIQEARERESVKQQEEEAAQLQENRDAQFEGTLDYLQRKLVEEAEAERQRAKPVRDAATKGVVDERVSPGAQTATMRSWNLTKLPRYTQ